MSMAKNVWGNNNSDADILKVRKTYYAMCSETDWMLGTVMDTANKTGHLKNTFIIFVRLVLSMLLTVLTLMRMR